MSNISSSIHPFACHFDSTQFKSSGQISSAFASIVAQKDALNIHHRVFILCIFNDYLLALRTLRSIIKRSEKYDVLIVKDASTKYSDDFYSLLSSNYFIESYLNLVTIRCSDHGPYDGMNSALTAAKLICPTAQCLIINSGDILLDICAVPRQGIVLCNQLNISNGRKSFRRPILYKSMPLTMIFGRVFHQSFFCPVNLLPFFNFRKYPIIADSVQILKVLASNDCIKCPQASTFYLGGGLSSNKFRQVTFEKLSFLFSNGFYLTALISVPVLTLRLFRVVIVSTFSKLK